MTKTPLLPITTLAQSWGLPPEYLIPFGHHKGKIALQARKDATKLGRLILVTAISPTPAGEGKTTVTIGLAQALQRTGRRVTAALREPSLGPVLGVKGGATGGGASQVHPAEDINLHFTGDIHAVTAAHNLLAALIDNSLQQGNPLRLDPRSIVWPRALDVNDRALRRTITGLGGSSEGVPRETGFIITAASEIMAILCLSQNYADLEQKIERILIGWNLDKLPVYVQDLGCAGALTALLRDALLPNLVQSSEGVPVLMHGGPFANIAHGCNSIIATQLAQQFSEYVVTEAGFATELGAEKFFHIKCRTQSLEPAAVVLVATLRALKYQAGLSVEACKRPALEALRQGFTNLFRHAQNIEAFGYRPFIALNRFAEDCQEEVELLLQTCRDRGWDAHVVDVFVRGGDGAIELARAIDKAAPVPKAPRYLYELDDPVEVKVDRLARTLYGAREVNWSDNARRKLQRFQKLGADILPICVAKTQNSLSDQPHLRGAPEDFTLNIQDCELSAGAGFLLLVAGSIIRMPGLPEQPNALKIRVNSEGDIVGVT
jgi:formate--tetrahydrofolate ligase